MKGKKGNKAPTAYAGGASNVAKEAEDKKDAFKKGGKVKKHVGGAEGKSAKKRLDKVARANGGKTPFSHAH
jgi:hypothetical protein